MPVRPRPWSRRSLASSPSPWDLEAATFDEPDRLGFPEEEAGSWPNREDVPEQGEPTAPSPVQPDAPGGSEAAGSLEYEDLEADAAGRAPARSDWTAGQAVRALRGAGRRRRNPVRSDATAVRPEEESPS
ncbi:hypothetical protein [Limnochorda pilosa]|uniref:Uncharacterized protein n=1 Tax=Limnochorda pilosa TaxID=1555112 RepID=A0A0K2SIN9_LIMPI|nr:hypothetical protein [Limnochorda pilosa]BAS26684.1 hypothetical protein LIP_0827 [Limnochorda pilosa]